MGDVPSSGAPVNKRLTFTRNPVPQWRRNPVVYIARLELRHEKRRHHRLYLLLPWQLISIGNRVPERARRSQGRLVFVARDRRPQMLVSESRRHATQIAAPLACKGERGGTLDRAAIAIRRDNRTRSPGAASYRYNEPTGAQADPDAPVHDGSCQARSRVFAPV